VRARARGAQAQDRERCAPRWQQPANISTPNAAFF